MGGQICPAAIASKNDVCMLLLQTLAQGPVANQHQAHPRVVLLGFEVSLNHQAQIFLGSQATNIQQHGVHLVNAPKLS